MASPIENVLDSLSAVLHELDKWNSSPSRTGRLAERVPAGHPLHTAVAKLEGYYGVGLPRPALRHWKKFLRLTDDDDESAEDEADWLRVWLKSEIQARDSHATNLGKRHPAEPPREANVDSPIGFLGGAELADALGIHETRRGAFMQQLGRKRKSLGDACWKDVGNPQPNSPRFLYRTDSAKLRDIAAAYKKPKPA